LVKPQFEVGRGKVGKGGIVRDEELHREAVEKIIQAGGEAGLSFIGERESPIKGREGNREFFVMSAPGTIPCVERRGHQQRHAGANH
jgi:23S rRNA (cytidine1920-2'-O)/16S rRNA (cytidine1409-2'-O)-methyltransferase